MKILAIASAGGHWVQLLRLKKAFDGHELIYLSTKEGNRDTVSPNAFYCIPDSNRNNKLGLFKSLFNVWKIVRTIKPSIVITTGAAPGLMGIIVGKILGAKTIWVDSIANVEQVSMSGKIAIRIADKVYTQWPDLANKKISYSGNILS